MDFDYDILRRHYLNCNLLDNTVFLFSISSLSLHTLSLLVIFLHQGSESWGKARLVMNLPENHLKVLKSTTILLQLKWKFTHISLIFVFINFRLYCMKFKPYYMQNTWFNVLHLVNIQCIEIVINLKTKKFLFY